MSMIEVRPTKPFVGSYRCSFAEADIIDEQLVEKDGLIVKEKVPRKRFVGLIPVQRAMTREESSAWAAGNLPPHLEPIEDGRYVIEHPKQRTVFVPAEVASSLISRGLAEKVDKKPPAKAA
jgi:hypothetical protein